jgi:tetratricopeptide (TPR) repeat protein/predicted Ser/Thr protein kinase
MMRSDERTRLDTPPRGIAADDTPAVWVPTAPDFGPRYRVIGVVGKGGMGEVYRAYDNELRGDVALKIVRADADHATALARFRREIALARKVTSPNVLRVYDLAEHKTLRFVSMEFVDGSDLATLLAHTDRLALDRALAIFRQVCVGLIAAHAQGVVHRDLKPQNVLIDRDDRVHVADFGLARSIGESGLTASGAILGSPAYMSPEQVTGDPADERSDIYSLGIMLYQLVTGHAPFEADTAHAVMAMRLHKPPPPLRERAPEAPAYLGAIVARCLQVKPADRYASVQALLADLDAAVAPARQPGARRRWLVPAAIAGVLAVGAATAWLATRPRGEPSTAPAAIAPVAVASDGPVTVLVLGVANHASDPVYDGTLDTVLLYALRRSSRIDPVAGVDLRKLAGELGADVAVDDQLGQKLAARDHVRIVNVRGEVTAKGAGSAISLTATDAATGAVVYSKSLDVPALDRVVASTAVLAAGLRHALGEKIDDAERERTGLSSSLDADHEFSIGLAMKQAANTEGAITHFEQAIAKDASFAFARAQLALQYSNASRRDQASEQFALALRSVDQIGERDRLKFLGDYYSFVREDWERATTSYTQLLAKWPRDQGAEVNLARVYLARGDAKHGLEAGERAAHDHPLSVIARSNLVEFEIAAGQFERAVADGNKFLKDFPRPVPTTHLYLGLAQALAGKHDEAQAELVKNEPIEASTTLAAEADLAFAEGRLADARKLLEKGIADDLAHHLNAGVELKQAMLAELRLRTGDKPKARAAAAAVANASPRLLEAALVQLAVGDDKRALATAARLAKDVAPSRRVIAMLIEAEALRVHGQPEQAVVAFQKAVELVDMPYGHFLLARAALDAKLYAEAYAELESCIARRGEIAISADDVPTLRHVPQLTYYLARAQAGMGSPQASQSYAAFVAMMPHADPDDPLVLDARAQSR